MPVMSPSLCIGAKQLVYLPPPNRNYFQRTRKRTRVSMQLQPWSQRNFPSIKAVLSCNAALNSKCSQGQTQTLTREAPTITQAPNRKDKSSKIDDGGSGIKLDDGGRGLPPRDGGGGGGGGGGGENFSGGFFLFAFLMFMGYLKDLEGEHENSY